MTYDLVTIGETMLRLMPPHQQRLEAATQFDLQFGGAESNTAVNLARLGKRSAWISRLPDNPLGQACAASIRKHGVDISHLTWSEADRLGLYFVEQGAAPRPTRVWYDRAHSAASHMTPADLPLDVIAASKWLHLTGIFPALSASCRETTQTALDHAKSSGVKTWFDVNYRALLWSAEQAAQTLTPFCQQADYVILARRDAVKLWGTVDHAAQAARELQAQWGGVVIVTDGDAGASAYDGENLVSVPSVATTLIDRMGAGDAFASGVLCRLLEDTPLEDALHFGAALAAIKLTIVGDIALTTRAEVEALLNNTGNSLHR